VENCVGAGIVCEGWLGAVSFIKIPQMGSLCPGRFTLIWRPLLLMLQMRYISSEFIYLLLVPNCNIVTVLLRGRTSVLCLGYVWSILFTVIARVYALKRVLKAHRV
jgi:hypothetical protein